MEKKNLKKLDILNREEFVSKLINLTENISSSRISTSFALNGMWGCGKSFVLDMYEEQLGQIQNEDKAIDKYFVIHYNCWKYDYYDEPLVAIVAAIIDVINEKTKLWNDENKKAWFLGTLKTIGTVLFSMVNDGIKDKLGVDVKEAFDNLNSNINEEKISIERSHEYDVYFSFNQALHHLQKLIKELSQDYTVVFVVDELDRCLPEYSIKVLERLHHLTEGSNNVITVLSMDKEQLQKSVVQIFGFEHPEKYLEKFIQFEIKLDYGEISEKITEKYSDYISMFDKNIFQFDDSVEEFIQAIFEDIDARTQEQLVKRATIAHKMLYSDSKDYAFMCMELLLTVLICVYNDNSCFLDNPIRFGQRDNAFDSIFISSINGVKPAFSDFFAEKYNILSFKQRQLVFDESIQYVLPENARLYCAVLYIWYFMHKKHPQIMFSHNKGDVYENIANHHKELKKFAETVKILK